MSTKNIKLFITGTDTNAGKTYISCGLLKAFGNTGWSTLGIKLVASGCEHINNLLTNTDTLALMAASTVKLPQQTITPFAFEPAIAPHIAAEQAGCKLTVASLSKAIHPALSHSSDISIIEGSGGWLVPLNAQETLADFVIMQKLPVILTVGIRLGCLNHALLTCEAIKSSGVNLIGWIGNQVDAHMDCADENISFLKNKLSVPCLGIVPHGQAAEEYINVEYISAVLAGRI